jgi:hypothetical protein
MNIPMLFFTGTRDSLCDLGSLRSVLGRLSGSWQLETIEGGDHSFRVPASTGMTAKEIHQKITQKINRWLQTIVAGQV